MKLKKIFSTIEIVNPVLLIGNSPSILNKPNHKINFDKYKTIIRFNDYKISGYENFVGSKTNIVFISNSYINQLNFKKNVDYILVDNSNKISESVASGYGLNYLPPEILLHLRYKYGPFANFLNNLNINGSWLNLIYPKNITLGLVAILLMIENKFDTYIHGIDYNYKTKSHYFKTVQDFSETHFYFYEKLILKKLLKKKLVKHL